MCTFCKFLSSILCNVVKWCGWKFQSLLESLILFKVLPGDQDPSGENPGDKPGEFNVSPYPVSLMFLHTQWTQSAHPISHFRCIVLEHQTNQLVASDY